MAHCERTAATPKDVAKPPWQATPMSHLRVFMSGSHTQSLTRRRKRRGSWNSLGKLTPHARNYLESTTAVLTSLNGRGYEAVQLPPSLSDRVHDVESVAVESEQRQVFEVRADFEKDVAAEGQSRASADPQEHRAWRGRERQRHLACGATLLGLLQSDAHGFLPQRLLHSQHAILDTLGASIGLEDFSFSAEKGGVM